jgi:hypothetical protein
MGKIMASKGWYDLPDNPASNHFLNWAISKYDDPILRFAVGIGLNMLKTPRTVHRDGDRDIQCCWCGEMNPDMAHITCNCKGNGRGWHYMNRRHRATVDAVAAAIRKGHRTVHIKDDVTISSICAEIDKERGGLKRPDLMYESFITKKGKTKKIFNMTEITSPWAWEGSLKRAYDFKKEKYAPVHVRFQQLNTGYSEVRLNVIVVSPSGVFPIESHKDFAIATGLSRGDLAAHSRSVVDAAITSAFEHYGVYGKAMGYKENVQGSRSQYTPVELEFQEEAADMDVVDSIRDVEAIECGETGPTVVREEAEMSLIELRKASEIEQNVREFTGIAEKPLFPHPDGLKKDGDDGKSDAFGRAYTKVRKTKPNPAPVSHIRTVPLRTPVEKNVEEIEVYFAFCGKYVPFIIRSDITQQQVEMLGSDYFKGNLGLIDFRPPQAGLHYRFKAMFCQDRENAAWIDCKRSDTADEEWVLFGQELSDNDIVRIMEIRWYVPLKKLKEKLPRPLENNSIVMFERLTDEEVEEEEVSGVPAADPMDLFRDRSWYRPPRPMTPVDFRSTEVEYDDQRVTEDFIPKIIHQITAGPHQVTLMLKKDAPPERILEVLYRRTGIAGKWKVTITDEGDIKKGSPRKVLLESIGDVAVPKDAPKEMIEARVFFGTLERKSSCCSLREKQSWTIVGKWIGPSREQRNPHR